MSLSGGPVTLLVVDDEEAIRNAVRKYLVQLGYEVVVAASGEEALGVLGRRKITGMLLDVNLPGANGIDLVPRIMELDPTVALLMLTAVNDATSAALCMQRGALDYLLKPIDLAHLGHAVARALERRRALLEGQQMNHWLKEEVALRVAERRLDQAAQERVSVATLEALVNALEAKDPYLRGHSARVADLSAIHRRPSPAARRGDRGGPDRGAAARHRQDRDPRGNPEQAGAADRRGVRAREAARAGRLPDPGARWSTSETSSPWSGATTSAGTASATPTAWPARRIPLGARIIGAVEIFDALTTARPYQEKMPPEEAVERMRELVGTAIDPTIHDALEAVVSRRQALVFLDDPQR